MGGREGGRAREGDRARGRSGERERERERGKERILTSAVIEREKKIGGRKEKESETENSYHDLFDCRCPRYTKQSKSPMLLQSVLFRKPTISCHGGRSALPALAGPERVRACSTGPSRGLTWTCPPT